MPNLLEIPSVPARPEFKVFKELPPRPSGEFWTYPRYTLESWTHVAGMTYATRSYIVDYVTKRKGDGSDFQLTPKMRMEIDMFRPPKDEEGYRREYPPEGGTYWFSQDGRYVLSLQRPSELIENAVRMYMSPRFEEMSQRHLDAMIEEQRRHTEYLGTLPDEAVASKTMLEIQIGALRMQIQRIRGLVDDPEKRTIALMEYIDDQIMGRVMVGLSGVDSFRAPTTPSTVTKEGIGESLNRLYSGDPDTLEKFAVFKGRLLLFSVNPGGKRGYVAGLHMSRTFGDSRKIFLGYVFDENVIPHEMGHEAWNNLTGEQKEGFSRIFTRQLAPFPWSDIPHTRFDATIKELHEQLSRTGTMPVRLEDGRVNPILAEMYAFAYTGWMKGGDYTDVLLTPQRRRKIFADGLGVLLRSGQSSSMLLKVLSNAGVNTETESGLSAVDLRGLVAAFRESRFSKTQMQVVLSELDRTVGEITSDILRREGAVLDKWFDEVQGLYPRDERMMSAKEVLELFSTAGIGLREKGMGVGLDDAERLDKVDDARKAKKPPMRVKRLVVRGVGAEQEGEMHPMEDAQEKHILNALRSLPKGMITALIEDAKGRKVDALDFVHAPDKWRLAKIIQRKIYGMSEDGRTLEIGPATSVEAALMNFSAHRPMFEEQHKPFTVLLDESGIRIFSHQELANHTSLTLNSMEHIEAMAFLEELRKFEGRRGVGGRPKEGRRMELYKLGHIKGVYISPYLTREDVAELVGGELRPTTRKVDGVSQKAYRVFRSDGRPTTVMVRIVNGETLNIEHFRKRDMEYPNGVG